MGKSLIGNDSGSGSISKIDNASTSGLLGINNSLAYRVHELEKHFHSEEHWYGSDGDGTGSTANNLTEWQLEAGSSLAYGTEVQILGANDISDSDFSFVPVKFDAHRIQVTVSSINDKNYMIQFFCGTGVFGDASFVTEVPYRTGGNATEVVPIPVQMSRIPVGCKVWARVKCETDSATLSFILGVHAYVG